MSLSISGIGRIPQGQIQAMKGPQVPKTVYTMANAHEMAGAENAFSHQGTDDGQLLTLNSRRREGYRSEYTQDDALASLWRAKHTRIDLNDPNTWQDISLKLDPTQAELDDLRESLSHTGLGGAVDWAGLDGELVSFENLTSAHLADGMDYFASRYVAVRDKLERNFSGDELAAQREKLDAAYQKGTSCFLDNYSETLERQLGLSTGEAQSVRNSLQGHLDQKIERYQATLEALESPTDQWLQNHDAYMAAQLRQSAAPAGGKRGSAEYSMEDLVTAGKIGETYQAMANKAEHATDEVQLALDMGMADMKTEALIHAGKLSSGMADLLKSTVERRHQAVFSTANQRLSTREGNRLSGELQGGFAPIDQWVVNSIYQQVMDTFRQSGGNAAKAIYQGVESAKTITAAAYGRSPEVSRWGFGMKSRLEHFYDPRTVSPLEQFVNDRFGLLDSTNSEFQNYADSWQRFLDSAGADI